MRTHFVPWRWSEAWVVWLVACTVGWLQPVLGVMAASLWCFILGGCLLSHSWAKLCEYEQDSSSFHYWAFVIYGGLLMSWLTSGLTIHYWLSFLGRHIV